MPGYCYVELGEKVKENTVLFKIYETMIQSLNYAKYANQYTVINLESMILGKYTNFYYSYVPSFISIELNLGLNKPFAFPLLLAFDALPAI